MAGKLSLYCVAARWPLKPDSLPAMIAIIDYQMGNLRSVQKALERVGHEAIITSDPSEVGRSEKVILPGVMRLKMQLQSCTGDDLVGPIKDAIAADKPFLGICLGLQMLFDVSYENGTHEGLGMLPGEVVRFQVPPELKVPHMGWNGLQIRRRPHVARRHRRREPFLLCPLLFCEAARRIDRCHRNRLWRTFCSMIWARQSVCHAVSPGKKPSRRTSTAEEFRRNAGIGNSIIRPLRRGEWSTFPLESSRGVKYDQGFGPQHSRRLRRLHFPGGWIEVTAWSRYSLSCCCASWLEHSRFRPPQSPRNGLASAAPMGKGSANRPRRFRLNGRRPITTGRLSCRASGNASPVIWQDKVFLISGDTENRARDMLVA